MALWRGMALPRIPGRVSPTTRRRRPRARSSCRSSAGLPNARRSARATAPVGVAVEAGADAQAHLADLAGRPLIALAFTKFADGRAFSYARLLRDRRGFAGELRATGDVLIDEIPLMLRCGFDAFEVSDAPTLVALEAGRLPGPALHYQPASVAGEVPAGARPWLRVDQSSA